MAELGFFLEIGTLMFLAFIGVMLINRFGQSVLIAYILIGIIIGPFGLRVIKSQPTSIASHASTISVSEISGILIYILSQFGLVLLIFFVGLEFSPAKMKRSQKPAVILAVFDVAINVFMGILLGTYFGWPIIDTIFLACIIAMSSVAITIKILEDLKRSGRPETEILISLMIVEDFASIIILTIATGFVVGTHTSTISIAQALIGIVVLFSFFIILAFVFIPMIVQRIQKVERGEGFILFALAIVFLSSALAEFFGLAAIIGAFLIGMGFADTKLSARLKDELASFKNAFVAIFFVSFGMLIDPSVFPQIWKLILLAVPLTVLNELILLAIIAFVIGMSAEASISVGAGALGRSEEAIIFANIGANLKTPAGAHVLSPAGAKSLAPFSGAYCLFMSIITPILMKSSYEIAGFFKRTLPQHLKFAGSLLARLLKSMVMSAKVDSQRSGNGLSVALFSYFVLMLVFIASEGMTVNSSVLGIKSSVAITLALFVLTVIAIFLVQYFSYERLTRAVRNMDIGSMPLNHEARRVCASYGNGIITGSLAAYAVMALVWNLNWHYTVAVMLAYVAALWLSAYYIHRRVAGELQWEAKYERQESKRTVPVVLKERPDTFTYRGSAWEHENPNFRKKARGK